MSQLSDEVRPTLEENGMHLLTRNILSAHDGKAGGTGSLGVRFMVDGDQTDGGFAMVEKSMAPRALAAPLHRHAREDEYTYVLEGRIGALLGDDVVNADVGDLMFRPRNQWHTFWNAGEEPARIIEIVTPAGLEGFFHELAECSTPPPPGSDEYEEMCTRYGLEMQPQSVPLLVKRFGLRFPGVEA
jgi:mannose-6-phosphate isomerase-like protein (cupin superfamily)